MKTFHREILILQKVSVCWKYKRYICFQINQVITWPNSIYFVQPNGVNFWYFKPGPIWSRRTQLKFEILKVYKIRGKGLRDQGQRSTRSGAKVYEIMGSKKQRMIRKLGFNHYTYAMFYNCPNRSIKKDQRQFPDLKFSNFYIFATWWCKPFYISSLVYLIQQIYSLKYLRSTALCCKVIGIRKFEFAGKYSIPS